MILFLKKISVLLIVIVLPFISVAQKDTTNNEKFESDTTIIDSGDEIKNKKKSKKSGFFRRSQKDEEYSESEDVIIIPPEPEKVLRIEWLNMSNEEKKEKMETWHKYDSAVNIQKYKLTEKERNLLRKRGKNMSWIKKIKYRRAKKKRIKFKKSMFDSKMNRISEIIPKKISGEEWLLMSQEEQNSLIKEWEKYDSTMLRNKYSNTPEERKLFNKKSDEMSMSEKRKLNKASKKPEKFREAMLKSRINRLDNILKFYKKNGIDTSDFQGMEVRERHKIVAEYYKVKNMELAIHRQKVILKYDEKEKQFREKLGLTTKEKIILNKGKGRVLKGRDKTLNERAKKKQIKFSKGLQELRKERHNALQDKKTMKRIKERERKREKEREKRRKNR